MLPVAGVCCAAVVLKVRAGMRSGRSVLDATNDARDPSVGAKRAILPIRFAVSIDGFCPNVSLKAVGLVETA